MTEASGPARRTVLVWMIEKQWTCEREEGDDFCTFILLFSLLEAYTRLSYLVYLLQSKSHIGVSLISSLKISILQPPFSNNPHIRRIPCGSFTTFATAKDLAKLVGIMANDGTHNGKSYISPQTVKRLTKTKTSGLEIISGLDSMRFGLGTLPVKSPLVS